jgi:hypothetical protein
MKKYNFVLMILLAVTFYASSTLAAFDIPSDVYRIDQLQQAKEEAKTEEKQIVFLYSDEHTTCPLATRASISIMQRFGHSAVVVYIYICPENWAKIPPIVREAFSSPEAGKFFPKTVVVDSGITKVVSIIPYERAGR